MRVWMHGLCSVLCVKQSVVWGARGSAKWRSEVRTEEQAYIGRWHPGHRCTPISHNQPAPQVLWETRNTKLVGQNKYT